MVEGDWETHLDSVLLYATAFPRPETPCILQRLSTVPANPAGPDHFSTLVRRAFNMPTKVQPEYTAKSTLCATTNQKKIFVLLIGQGLLPAERL